MSETVQTHTKLRMTDDQLRKSGTATLMPNEFDALVEELVALRARAAQAQEMATAILNGYPDPNIGHEDYRVQVARWADDFLESQP